MRIVDDLRLALIAADPDLQPRVGGLDHVHVRSLEETPDHWPPVAVVRQGHRYLLVDGFHRLAAAQNLGLPEIAAVVLDPPDDGDLHGLAFRLNLGHGRPLTLADRRAYAARILQARPELSDRAIGELAALSGNTVTAIRREMEAAAHIERPTERVGRGGYAYRETGRALGELPEPSVGESLGAVATALVSGSERAKQRKWVAYLQRVGIALRDQYALPDWDDASIDDIANACHLVLGDDKALTLARHLGPSAGNLVRLAQRLDDNPSETP